MRSLDRSLVLGVFLTCAVVGCDEGTADPDAGVDSGQGEDASLGPDAGRDAAADGGPPDAGCTVPGVPACARPGVCGCDAVPCADGSECADGEYCAFCDPGEGCAGDSALCFGMGVCLPQPADCLGEPSSPVCGCDRMTYDNACLAAQAGVTAAASRACETYLCIGGGCLEDEFCAEAGACDSVATCAPRPEDCPTEVDPVCGCDGATYENACLAHLSGVTVDHAGACAAPPCSNDADCEASEYCAHCDPELGCGGDSLHCFDAGTCAPRPPDCSGVPSAPVCGCDRVTYDNPCLAQMAGVTIAAARSCATYLCIGGGCLDGEFCDAAGMGCDIVATCAPRPASCPPEVDPVCGCDGATYDSACLARFAGVTVDHPGGC